MKSAVIITGAGSGIGEAAALLFSESGHDVVLVGRRESKLIAVSKKLKGRSLVIPCDVSDIKSSEQMISTALKKYPHIGILVNNAAVFEQKSFLDSDIKLWNETLQINLLGPINLIQKLIPHFKKIKSGMVVNVASTAGLKPISGMITYSTSKAALIHLTQSLALEYAKQNICFHAVCPGVIDTPIHKGKRKENLKEMDSWHPLGRVGQPHEVAKAIYYLACQSDWMTGVVLPVDGGISLT